MQDNSTKTRRTGCVIGKGGPGKSTIAMAIATGLPIVGKKHDGLEVRTLLVDYDPQANASFVYRANIKSAPTMYHVYSGEADIHEAIQHTEQGDIIPANQLLTKVESLFDNYLEAVDKLGEALDALEGEYTHIIIDNQPLIGGILTTQALAACTDLVVPVTAEVFSLQGLERLQQAIASIRKRINPGLTVDGLLLNKFNPRFNLSGGLMTSIQKWAQENDTRVYKTYIRESVAVREAQTVKQSLFEYAPTSNPAKDFLAFLENEYLDAEGGR
ncbi:ParA family protein [Eubacteriales bacterium OttesenSCG-928-A19]|nr:ParA family protein [Eubacteriales bacterium OttesenSCG-928-A19]